MKIKKISVIIVIFFILIFDCKAEDWYNFTSNQMIKNIVFDGQYIWTGDNGLTRIDPVTNDVVLYNIANSGLLDNKILSLAIDKNKSIWIGTPKGLSKFDNNTWTYYISLPNNFKFENVKLLAVDSNNCIWAGTNDFIAKFDRESWTIYNSFNTPLPQFCCFSGITVDSKNTLYVGVNPEQFNSYIGVFKNNDWTYLDSKNSKIPFSKIVNVIAKNDTVWICSENGIYYIVDSKFKEFLIINQRAILSKSLYFDKSDNLLIPTGYYIDDKCELITYNFSGKKVIKIEKSLPFKQIDNLLIDNNENIWITNGYINNTNEGLAKNNGKSWETINVSNSGLKDEWITSIAIDSLGNKWFGTEGGGISKFDGNNWININNSNSLLFGNYISKIEVDKNNIVWVLSDKGINYIDKENCQKFDKFTEKFYSLGIESLMADSDGNLWIGGKNLYVYKNGALNSIPFKDANFENNTFIFSITKNVNGTLYIGTRNGIFKLDKKKKNLDIDSSVKPRYDDIHQIAFDRKNIMWLSNYYYRPPFDNYDTDQSVGCIIQYNKSTAYYNKSNSGLPADFAEVIIIDKNNKVWFGTRNGLCSYDGSKWEIFNIENSGLPSNQISSLCFDKLGNLWIGTTKGLAVYRKGGVKF